MKPGDGTTVIGKPAKFRGDLFSAEDLQIDGEFEGTIRLSAGRLTVGVDAKVRATISASDVVVFGRVEGDIHATGRVDLRSTAVVLGDVFAGRLSIEDNAALRGYVDPSRAGETIPTTPVAAKPVAVTPRAGLSSAAASLGTPRAPELFDPQTGSSLSQSRQMPSALAAIAAAGRSEASQDEDSHDDHRDDDAGHLG